MYKFSMREVADMFEITPSSFSGWCKAHKNELESFADHIEKTSKTIFFDIIAVTEVAKLRNQELPKQISQILIHEKSNSRYQDIINKYNITTLYDALDVIAKFEENYIFAFGFEKFLKNYITDNAKIMIILYIIKNPKATRQEIMNIFCNQNLSEEEIDEILMMYSSFII